jgi:hypothetical protein
VNRAYRIHARETEQYLVAPTLDMGSVLSSGQGETAAATVAVAAASLTG